MMDENLRAGRHGSGKVAVLVLGMHRSGTSALAGVVNALGCRNPRTLLPANERNPKGYFESAPIVRLNDEILNAAGSHWSDWRPLAPSWWLSPRFTEFRQRARALLEQEYGEATLIGLKDPRMCRLLPLWRQVLEEAGFDLLCIHIHRHPTEVATSLERRGTIAVQPGVGQLAWLRYVLDAEEHSRDLPRAFVSYDELLNDWRKIKARTEQTFGPIWPATHAAYAKRIDDLLDLSLRHHSAEARAPTSSSYLPDDVQSCYQILQDWTTGGESEERRTLLDDVRAGFDRASNLFSGTLAIADRSAQEIEALKQRLDAGHQHLEAALREAEAAREAALSRHSAEIDNYVERLVQRDRTISSLRRDFDKFRRDKAAMEKDIQSRLAKRESKIKQLNDEMLARAAFVDDLHQAYSRSTSWRITAPVRAIARIVGRSG